MVQINLLPWRETQRIEKNRIFYVSLSLALAGGALLLLIIYGFYIRKIAQQAENNQFLEKHIQMLESKTTIISKLSQTRKTLVEQNKTLRNLRAQRYYIVQLFNSIAKALPNGLSVSNISKTDAILTFVGEAQNNAVISVFMDRLASVPWFSEPVLSEIKTKTRKLQFVLQVRYQIPEATL